MTARQEAEDTMTMTERLMPTDQLKSCPFCGSDAISQCDDKRHYVACLALDCFCAVGEGYDRDAMPDHIFGSEEEAVAAWNRRALSSTLEAPADDPVKAIYDGADAALSAFADWWEEGDQDTGQDRYELARDAFLWGYAAAPAKAAEAPADVRI